MPIHEDTLDAVIRVGRLALDFGRINRITFHPDGITPESDTDHTVMLGLVACMIADKWFPGLDKGRITNFALVHDLVEVYAGDTPTLRQLDPEARAAKKDREREALDRIFREFRGEFSWLPFTIAAYEDGASSEARFVRMLDKVLPKITHLLNGAVTITAEGMTREQLIARYEAQGRELEQYADQFPEVEELRRALVGRLIAQLDEQDSGDIRPKPGGPSGQAGGA